jgi:hypothetical protein
LHRGCSAEQFSLREKELEKDSDEEEPTSIIKLEVVLEEK